jgi:uncharacterized DUF497 family protein/predicted DNA binding CopG/RHH family protein
MSALHFEWDDKKATANVKKHGISFEEAKSVFRDERAKLINDPDHSEDEDRFILLGLSETLRLLVVCHCTVIEARITSYELSPPVKPRARNQSLINEGAAMRQEYDFSNAKQNPYASKLKKQVTIRLDEEAINYFKSVSEEVGIPYQSLINLYLRDCAASHRKLNLNWK